MILTKRAVAVFRWERSRHVFVVTCCFEPVLIPCYLIAIKCWERLSKSQPVCGTGWNLRCDARALYKRRLRTARAHCVKVKPDLEASDSSMAYFCVWSKYELIFLQRSQYNVQRVVCLNYCTGTCIGIQQLLTVFAVEHFIRPFKA